jgi:hypothetical protein
VVEPRGGDAPPERFVGGNDARRRRAKRRVGRGNEPRLQRQSRRAAFAGRVAGSNRRGRFGGGGAGLGEDARLAYEISPEEIGQSLRVRLGDGRGGADARLEPAEQRSSGGGVRVFWKRNVRGDALRGGRRRERARARTRTRGGRARRPGANRPTRLGRRRRSISLPNPNPSRKSFRASTPRR